MADASKPTLPLGDVTLPLLKSEIPARSLAAGIKSDPNLLHRKNQEDAAIVVALHFENPVDGFCFGQIAAVLDGMGGGDCGEKMSQMACALLVQQTLFELLNGIEIEQIPEALRAAITITNRRLYAQSRQQGRMGTTVALVLVIETRWEGSHLFVLHCGDSRVYAIHYDDTVVQLTTDHSLVQELVQSGVLTEEEAIMHPDGNQITAVLGAYPSLPHYEVSHLSLNGIQPLHLLLMTDGVWLPLLEQAVVQHGTVARFDDTLRAAVHESPTLQHIAERLVSEAILAGGQDNATAIALQVGGSPFSQSLATPIHANDTDASLKETIQ